MSVSDKGDMQNEQSSGSRGTGLKTTGVSYAEQVGCPKCPRESMLRRSEGSE